MSTIVGVASSAATSSPPVLLVAASNAPSRYLAAATYLCDGTDDHVQINAAVASAAALGGRVELSPGLFLTRDGVVHRSNVCVTGGGAGATTVRNVYNSSSFAQAIAWHLGTYGPGVGGNATRFETGYTIQNATTGAQTLTFITAGNSASFSVGDLVSIEGGTTTASSLSIPNEMTTVLAVGTGTITLEHALTADYTAGVATPTVRRLNTGALTLGGSWTSGTAFAARNAILEGLTIETTRAGYPAINLACYESVVRDCRLIGFWGLSGNPAARSVFADCRINFTHGAVEIAYLSHDTRFDRVSSTRYGTDAQASSSIGYWINSSEGARRVHFTSCDIEDEYPSSTSTHQTVELAPQSTWRGGSISSNRGTAGAVYAGADSLVDGAVVTKSAGHCFEMGGRSTLRNAKTLTSPTGASQFAVIVPSGSDAVVVEGASLGDPGSRTAKDIIRNQGTNLRVRNNQTFFTKSHLYKSFPVTHTGTTTATDAFSVTWPAGGVELGSAFDVSLAGSTTGTVGNKTVQVRVNTTAFVTLTITGAVNWSLKGRLGVAQGSGTWYYEFLANVNGTATVFTGTASRDYPSSTALNITYTLADVTDGIVSRLVEIKPIDAVTGYA